MAREQDSAGGVAHGKIGKREIARAFGIKGADRIALKRLLKDLEADGVVERRHKALQRPGLLPNVVVADITGRDADGEFIAVPVEWDTQEHGPAPKIILHLPRKPRPGMPTPGVGDRALLRAERNHDAERGDPAYAGRVVKLLSRAKMLVLGIFRAAPTGGGRLVPIDKKNLNRELLIPPGAEGEAEDGDLVSVDILREGRFGLPAAKVRERLGSMGSERAISKIAIAAHGIPDAFERDALAEAEATRSTTLDGREDWRRLALVTIDPPDAKDHDDAVHAAADSDPDNRGGFVLTVAIADVAHYVRPGRALDRAALARGNSVYFPDRVVPMLPERISNDLCSLRPDEDRPALAVRMTISADGSKRRHSFHRIMMRSAAKLSYQQAQAAIDGAPDDVTSPLLQDVLQPLWNAYAALKIARDARSPLDLDLPERKLVLAPDGKVDRVTNPPRLDAHRLIEEFMILANVAAAETLEGRRQPLLYRVHDEPTTEKLNNLAEFLGSVGIKLAKGQVLKPSQFNGILAKAKGTDNENLVNEMVLRSQAQAEYAAENYGHFGLHLRRYAHFTSPIRRYADLVVHRALIRALGLGRDGLPDMDLDALAEVAASISAAERRAMAAERETTDRLVAFWLADRVGASFEGRISGVTRAGLFVKLALSGADGFIPAATLGADYFRYEEGLQALIGNRTGETHRLGDLVEVKLVEAAPFAGALRFELLSEGRRRPARSGGKATKPKRRDIRSAGGEARPEPPMERRAKAKKRGPR
ncbi:MAG TPA: ribonuclease R [Beijerinckiaceae bacterium]|nr:ribonuclease R [Beijerinckiaceae bacterium]